MSEQEKKVVPAESTEKKADKSSGAEKSKESKSQKASKPSAFSRMKKWMRELRGETKKVVWPNRQLVIKNTTIVATVVLLVGAFIWILDFALNFGLSFFIGLL